MRCERSEADGEGRLVLWVDTGMGLNSPVFSICSGNIVGKADHQARRRGAGGRRRGSRLGMIVSGTEYRSL
jgi:hypothetical protein